MMATKEMIKREIWGVFTQIAEYAKRSGSDLENVSKDIDRIEQELSRLKYLAREYETSPFDWQEEYQQKEMTNRD